MPLVHFCFSSCVWLDFSVHYLSSLLSRSVCDRRLMFSVSAWKLITVLTSVRLSWQSRCLYLALSIMHSICTFISCFVSFSHMLSQAPSFCLFLQYLSDGHSIRSHHRNLLALRKLMANLITVATWRGNTNSVCLIQTGKVGERTWNEMRPQVMVSTYQLPHLSQCSPQSTAH